MTSLRLKVDQFFLPFLSVSLLFFDVSSSTDGPFLLSFLSVSLFVFDESSSIEFVEDWF
jgi:hypothetical protein